MIGEPPVALALAIGDVAKKHANVLLGLERLPAAAGAAKTEEK
jgi:hypothetical protein